MNGIKPIFLMSLPRSGSTLFQRVLVQHPNIATTAEPWLLLPFVYATRTDGATAEYGQTASARAVSGFLKDAGVTHAEYLNILGDMCGGLYEKCARSGETYFLDKTPRYHLIAEELPKIFPNAKFIYLWRNPVAIAASMIETWGSGRWNLFLFSVDLYQGLAALVREFETQRVESHAIRFEDLVGGSRDSWRQVFAYLGEEFDESYLTSFSDTVLGRSEGRGDPVGTKKYRELSDEPKSNWLSTICNPLRRYWMRRYLQWIGDERLTVMGYELESLLQDIDAAPWRSGSRLFSDVLRFVYGWIFTLCDYPHLKARRRGRRIVCYS